MIKKQKKSVRQSCVKQLQNSARCRSRGGVRRDVCPFFVGQRTQRIYQVFASTYLVGLKAPPKVDLKGCGGLLQDEVETAGLVAHLQELPPLGLELETQIHTPYTPNLARTDCREIHGRDTLRVVVLKNEEPNDCCRLLMMAIKLVVRVEATKN